MFNMNIKIKELFLNFANALEALPIEYHTPEFAAALWTKIATGISATSRLRHTVKAVAISDTNTVDVSIEYGVRRHNKTIKVTKGDNHTAIFYEGFPFFATKKPYKVRKFMNYAKRMSPGIMEDGVWEKFIDDNYEETEKPKTVKMKTDKKKLIGVKI